MATGRVPTTANSPLTAKGDLFGYSTTQARVPVGSDGETLVADSSATTGLRWQTPATLNSVINGGMDIWQRGTSGTATASVFYTADRWYVYAITNSPFARSTSVPTGAGCQYSLEVTGATSGTDIYIGQRIESVNIAPIKGTVTISAYIYNETGSSVTPTLRLDTPTSVDNFSSANQYAYTLQACPNNAWTRVTQTVDISALTQIDNGLALIFYGWTMSSNTKKVRITGVKIERGSVATQFVRSAGTLAGELAACQRYYIRQGGDTAFQTLASGYGASTTTAVTTMTLPVKMRVAPTSVDFSTIRVHNTSAGYAITAVAIDTNFNSSFQAVATSTIGSASLTIANGYIISANNSTSGYLGFSAEL